MRAYEKLVTFLHENFVVAIVLGVVQRHGRLELQGDNHHKIHIFVLYCVLVIRVAPSHTVLEIFKLSNKYSQCKMCRNQLAEKDRNTQTFDTLCLLINKID